MATPLNRQLWSEHTSAFLACLLLALFAGFLGTLGIIYYREGIFGYCAVALAAVSMAAAVGVLRRRRWGAALAVVAFAVVLGFFITITIGKPLMAWLGVLPILGVFWCVVAYYRGFGQELGD